MIDLFISLIASTALVFTPDKELASIESESDAEVLCIASSVVADSGMTGSVKTSADAKAELSWMTSVVMDSGMGGSAFATKLLVKSVSSSSPMDPLELSTNFRCLVAVDG